jgi:hypothetical protein
VATGSQLSILDGQYKHRLATVSGTLDGFKITKGYAFSNGTSGGGVLITGETVQNCILINNVASNLTPTDSTNIPGDYVASIGDIYCTDGTILSPKYNLNISTGEIEASLPGGIPNGKIPQGIICNTERAATSRRIYIMAKVSSNQLQPWFQSTPNYDFPLTNITSQSSALAAFNGASNSNSLNTQYQNAYTANIFSWIEGWDKDNPVPYCLNYNTPSGTQGKWYLPAAGELYKIWEVYPQMDACARDVLGWIGTGSTMFKKGYYWSSTEYDATNVWILDTNSYPWGTWGLIQSSKSGGGYTIPVATLTLPGQ